MQITPTPKILPRRALLQPCDQTWGPRRFRYSLPIAAPPLDLHSTASSPSRRHSSITLVTLFPAQRFSLSRRPLIEHHPTAANNKPGPTVQTIARPSSILHHFIPIPLSASNCRALNLTRQPTQLCQSQPRRPRRFSCIAPRTTVSVRELFFWGHRYTCRPRTSSSSFGEKERTCVRLPGRAAAPSPVAQLRSSGKHRPGGKSARQRSAARPVQSSTPPPPARHIRLLGANHLLAWVLIKGHEQPVAISTRSQDGELPVRSMR